MKEFSYKVSTSRVPNVIILHRNLYIAKLFLQHDKTFPYFKITKTLRLSSERKNWNIIFIYNFILHWIELHITLNLKKKTHLRYLRIRSIYSKFCLKVYSLWISITKITDLKKLKTIENLNLLLLVS